MSFPLTIVRQNSWRWSWSGKFGDCMDYQRGLFRIEIRYSWVHFGVRLWGYWNSSWTNHQHTIPRLMVKQNESTKSWNTTYVRTVCGTRMIGLTCYPLQSSVTITLSILRPSRRHFSLLTTNTPRTTSRTIGITRRRAITLRQPRRSRTWTLWEKVWGKTWRQLRSWW